MRAAAALAAGLLVALALAGLPASATTQSVAVSYTSWNPSSVAVQASDDVTWSNSTGFMHNVCVAAAGASSGCGEFRSGDPSDAWPSGGFSHRFASAGTYKFICEKHQNMSGTITVSGSGSDTGTTPPPDSQPTDTITLPTQAPGSTAPADTAAPGFVGTPKRRASRKARILELRSTEQATLQTTVRRRPPGGRAFRRIGAASLHVRQGKNVVTLPRKATGSLRKGAYRVTLRLVDAARNRSPLRTLAFKLR